MALPQGNDRRALLTLSLCLHELATNAAKYGALSDGSSRVDITWKLISNGTQKKVRLLWCETGGPLVTVPERKGFGSRLIEHSFSGEGEGCVDFCAAAPVSDPAKPRAAPSLPSRSKTRRLA
jgi:two-component sensor histidine kinase